jgi:hypothetical protein
MKRLPLLISLLCCIISIAATDPEAALRFFEYCSYHNYPVEDHIVPTDDHYNLQFYRIQGKTLKMQPKIPRSQVEGVSYISSMD